MSTERQFKGVANVFASVEDGRLGRVAVNTDALEFEYIFYQHDNTVSLHLARRFDDYHRRTIEAYVNPDVAQKLITIFSTGRGIGSDEVQVAWKYLFDVVDIMINSQRDVASIRIGNDDHGVMVTLGYQHKSDGQFYVFATVEWRENERACTVHESDLVPRELLSMLRHYLENVLVFIRPCLQ
jgi:hypothetical protein